MLEAGQIIENKYRIIRLIGEGGMGSVYEGENTFIKRRVAIKVLHAHSVSEETVRRFEREAQAAGCIGSDHILEVLDLGSLANGDRFMVMEYLDGETLGARMSRGRMNPRDVLAIARQVLIGLHAAHLANIVHRDLKPDNVFILREKAGRADFAKIIDFGISKFNALGGDMGMTRTGAVMGTPYYMSPEQAQGAQGIDGRSDVYALGVILYEALAGFVPFDGDTFNELLFKIVLSNPRPLSQVAPALDPRLIAFVEKAMARDLAARFQSADEMIRALDAQFGTAEGGDPQVTAVLPVVAAPVLGGPTAGSPGVGGPATPGLPTGNTWTASQNDIPKHSNAPAYAIAGFAVLLVAGGAFAAYQKFGSQSPAVATPHSIKAEDSATVAPSPPVPVVAQETPTAPAVDVPIVAPSAQPAEPSVTPSAKTTEADPASLAAPVKPPQPTPKPAAAKPPPAPAKPAAAVAAPAKPPAAKPARDFGY
ncbi:MAG TPA: serine/threonine-protein kinase [Polyangiaceae bacterium]|nr:serine/threonine-protein kinase [Polyangiaceae bacterium]